MSKIYFVFISILSLIIRFIYGYYSLYNCDQARVFDLGFQIYKYHILPVQGSPIVYTNSLLPGSLQAILAAIPLYFSGGHPYSIILFVQLLNFISCIILYKVHSTLFSNINKYFIFAFIVLNPMNIIWSYAWNPSFMILFATLFFLGLVKIIQNKADKFGMFLFLFPHLLILQLNLQFLILAVLALVLIIRKIVPFPSIKILVFSIIPGAVTLLPMIVQKFQQQSIEVNNWNMNGNLLHNIQFNFENIFSYFHVLARFLSFATGETTRSLGEGFIYNHPQVWLFFIIGILGVLFLFCISILFYLDKDRWKIFWKRSEKFSTYEKVDCALLYLPIIATFLFIFSVTPPTTHKIWILFPFCFYPFFRIIVGQRILDFFQFKLNFFFKKRFIFFTIYTFSALIYSTIGAATLSPNFANVFQDSKSFCKEKSTSDINLVLNTVEQGSKEYAMAMLCQYWVNFSHPN